MALVFTGLLTVAAPFVSGDAPLRIMPVGDSITRGTYMGGNTIANPLGGGWRKPLQDSLRAVGLDFEFVGELDYWAYGLDGVVDPQFFPKHHGLAGFSNTTILNGGVVPTPQEVLDAKGGNRDQRAWNSGLDNKQQSRCCAAYVRGKRIQCNCEGSPDPDDL